MHEVGDGAYAVEQFQHQLHGAKDHRAPFKQMPRAVGVFVPFPQGIDAGNQGCQRLESAHAHPPVAPGIPDAQGEERKDGSVLHQVHAQPGIVPQPRLAPEKRREPGRGDHQADGESQCVQGFPPVQPRRFRQQPEPQHKSHHPAEKGVFPRFQTEKHRRPAVGKRIAQGADNPQHFGQGPRQNQSQRRPRGDKPSPPVLLAHGSPTPSAEAK